MKERKRGPFMKYRVYSNELDSFVLNILHFLRFYCGILVRFISMRCDWLILYSCNMSFFDKRV